MTSCIPWLLVLSSTFKASSIVSSNSLLPSWHSLPFVPLILLANLHPFKFFSPLSQIFKIYFYFYSLFFIFFDKNLLYYFYVQKTQQCTLSPAWWPALWPSPFPAWRCEPLTSAPGHCLPSDDGSVGEEAVSLLFISWGFQTTPVMQFYLPVPSWLVYTTAQSKSSQSLTKGFTQRQYREWTRFLPRRICHCNWSWWPPPASPGHSCPPWQSRGKFRSLACEVSPLPQSRQDVSLDPTQPSCLRYSMTTWLLQVKKFITIIGITL